MEQHHFLTTLFPRPKFTAAEQDAVVNRFKPVQFSRNDYLLREGKTATQYWLLESGFARSYVTDAAGNDITTHFYGPGDIVMDWSSFFLQQPTRENIQALTACQCWQLEYLHFQELFHGIETFREHGRTNFAASYFTLKSHSIGLIADNAAARYKKLLQEKPLLVQNVSVKHMATYLGITDTSLSRIRRELAKESS